MKSSALLWLLMHLMILDNKNVFTNKVLSTGKDSIVKEFRIIYHKGIPGDSLLSEVDYYDLFSRRIQKMEVYSSIGKLYRTFNYFYSNNNTKGRGEANTVNIYRSINTDEEFVDGKLYSRTLFDKNHNIKKKTNYFESGRHVTMTFQCHYIEKRLIKTESYVYDNIPNYTANYYYNSKLQLTSKTFSNTSCCERNQAYPTDKIIYKNNSRNRLSETIEIIDWKMNHSYKNKKEFLTQLIITEFEYDGKDRLIRKIKYQPITSLNRVESIDNLILRVKNIDEIIAYKYIIKNRENQRFT